MTNIEYTYEVIEVNNANKTMTIRYTAVNYPTIDLVLPFPVPPDTVENRANGAAPLQKWREVTNQLVIPTVGESGAGKEVQSVKVKFEPI